MTIIRDDKGRFQKGQSANPAGRPTLADELPTIDGMKAACTADRVQQVLDNLFNLATSKKCSPQTQVRAGLAYLAYAIGKPVQQDIEARLAELESKLGIRIAA